jgi:hypothetical protein
MKGLLAILVPLLVALPATAAPASPPPQLNWLWPGEAVYFADDVTVNIVFVGYEEGYAPWEIDLGWFGAILPPYTAPVLRNTLWDAAPETEVLPLVQYYDYQTHFADGAFEESFFQFLSDLAVPAELTVYQEQYNGQQAASLSIDGNAELDVVAVEHWLAENAGPMLGIDTASPTVFFINWYGRPDFMHHVYVKTGETMTDTGADLGATRQDHRRLGGGGSAWNDPESGLGERHRIWFFDLSAGPEAWTDNWNVDDAEPAEGSEHGAPNGIMDYRLPPVWEYGNYGAYRPFWSVSYDLALLTRFVFIDLIVGASPLYDPIIRAPYVPKALEIDVSAFVEEGLFDYSEWIDEAEMLRAFGDLLPWHTFSSDVEVMPLSQKLVDLWDTGYTEGKSKFGERYFGISFWDLTLYFLDHILQFLEGDADYEVPVFAFAMGDGHPLPYAGMADANHADIYKQALVFSVLTPEVAEAGVGQTDVLIHETGHHLGLSHPHDGVDFWGGMLVRPRDAFYFAWAGDEHNTVMNYFWSNNEFSQFDQDNLARWLVVSYFNLANDLLGKIYENKKAGQQAQALQLADAYAYYAVMTFFYVRDFSASEYYARKAYDLVLGVAEALNIPLEAAAWQASYARSVNKRPGLRKLMTDFRGPGAISDLDPTVGVMPPLEQFLSECGGQLLTGLPE